MKTSHRHFPHFAVVGLLCAFVLIGYASDSAFAGRFIGLLLGTVLQPQTIIISVLCGFIAEYRKFLIVTIVCSILVALVGIGISTNNRSALGLEQSGALQMWLFAAYFCSFQILAHVVNLFRTLLMQSK